MKAHVITIGNELLIGDVDNTNASWIGRFLTENGIRCNKIITAGDDSGLIIDEVDASMKQADLTVLTGGLGPTHDDVTKNALAEYFNEAFECHRPTLEHIQKMFRERNLPFTESNREQADVLASSEVLFNPRGTAPGMWLSKQGHYIAVLPGVPSEMRYLMQQEVLPRIRRHLGHLESYHARYFHIAGVGESTLSDMNIGDMQKVASQDVSLAYLSGDHNLTLRVSCYAPDEQEAEALLQPAVNHIRDKAGALIFSEEKQAHLGQAVGRRLMEKKLQLAVAESCTGGYISNHLTDVSGSSGYFRGGILAYSNKVKVDQLGVAPESLDKEGAVSKPVALQMARNVAERLEAGIGLSITGVAGPDGGTEQKPVGTIWIGYWSEQDHFALPYRLFKDRLVNKQKSAMVALEVVRRRLAGLQTMPYSVEPHFS